MDEQTPGACTGAGAGVPPVSPLRRKVDNTVLALLVVVMSLMVLVPLGFLVALYLFRAECTC